MGLAATAESDVRMAVRCSYVVIAILAALGAILIIIGGCLIPVFNKQVSYSTKHFVLPDGYKSESYKAWLNWTHFKPVYRYFYFFDVLNPAESIATGKNTTVNQTGPYVYRVNFERRNVSFECKNTCLSYELYKTYTFERNMSIGDETDEITTVNLPILNLATRLLHTNKTVKGKVGKIIKRQNETLYSRVSVSDLLWGYENKNLKVVVDFLDAYFDFHPLNDTKYGLMYQSGQPQRTTFQGAFEASTGTDALSDLWNIKTWNGNSSLSAWKWWWCNKINGTDGYAWPPGQKKSQSTYIFDSDWCRSISLIGKDQESVRGLQTVKYTYDWYAFHYEKARKGFCKPTPKGKQSCLEDGVLNVTSCKDNIPLLLSQPHFLGAGKRSSYLLRVKGLNPNPVEHMTNFNIEPVTGEVVEASRKMQLNAYVMHLSSFPTTKQFNRNHTVVPVVWMKEVYSITDKERDSVYRETIKRQIYDGVQYGLIALGALLFVCALVALIVISVQSRGPLGERQPLLRNR